MKRELQGVAYWGKRETRSCDEYQIQKFSLQVLFQEEWNFSSFASMLTCQPFNLKPTVDFFIYKICLKFEVINIYKETL